VNWNLGSRSSSQNVVRLIGGKITNSPQLQFDMKLIKVYTYLRVLSGDITAVGYLLPVSGKILPDYRLRATGGDRAIIVVPEIIMIGNLVKDRNVGSFHHCGEDRARNGCR
jgi:hypothetical protein